eukprot:TRINITY_DN1870_c0_g1_i1.p1 TRINITY_DN1870_c0_g1~~TRINITY_DN1870_c0_g1_i1.p1  ORF type:complete len:1356 (-),score=359.56 TRINITY_DN1870_c0_g1_i1:50-4117(-)
MAPTDDQEEDGSPEVQPQSLEDHSTLLGKTADLQPVISEAAPAAASPGNIAATADSPSNQPIPETNDAAATETTPEGPSPPEVIESSPPEEGAVSEAAEAVDAVPSPGSVAQGDEEVTAGEQSIGGVSIGCDSKFYLDPSEAEESVKLTSAADSPRSVRSHGDLSITGLHSMDQSVGCDSPITIDEDNTAGSTATSPGMALDSNSNSNDRRPPEMSDQQVLAMLTMLNQADTRATGVLHTDVLQLVLLLNQIDPNQPGLQQRLAASTDTQGKVEYQQFFHLCGVNLSHFTQKLFGPELSTDLQPEPPRSIYVQATGLRRASRPQTTPAHGRARRHRNGRPLSSPVKRSNLDDASIPDREAHENKLLSMVRSIHRSQRARGVLGDSEITLVELRSCLVPENEFSPFVHWLTDRRSGSETRKFHGYDRTHSGSLSELSLLQALTDFRNDKASHPAGAAIQAARSKVTPAGVKLQVIQAQLHLLHALSQHAQASIDEAHPRTSFIADSGAPTRWTEEDVTAFVSAVKHGADPPASRNSPSSSMCPHPPGAARSLPQRALSALYRHNVAPRPQEKPLARPTSSPTRRQVAAGVHPKHALEAVVVGSQVWCCSKEDGVVIRDASNSKRVAVLAVRKPLVATTLCFVPGDEHRSPHVWVGTDQGPILVYDVPPDTVVQELCRHTDYVLSMIHRDTAVWTSSSDCRVAQWNAYTGEFEREFRGHSGPVRAVIAMKPQLWTASDDTSVRVWDLGSGGCYQVLHGHRAGVGCLLAAAGRVWSGDDAGELRVWDPATCKELKCVSTKLDTISSLLYTPRRIWAVGEADCAHVWDCHTCEFVEEVGLKPVQNPKSLTCATQEPVRAVWAYSGVDKGAVCVHKCEPIANVDPVHLGELITHNRLLLSTEQHLEHSLSAAVRSMWDLQNQMSAHKRQHERALRELEEQQAAMGAARSSTVPVAGSIVTGSAVTGGVPSLHIEDGSEMSFLRDALDRSDVEIDRLQMALKHSQTETQAALELNALDRDRDGVVNQAEFISSGGDKELFSQYDVDGDGVIDCDEMTLKVVAEEQAEVTRQAKDLNEDGVVDQQEFVIAGGSKAQFEELDLNHDGKLDAMELEMEAVGVVKQQHREETRKTLMADLCPADEDFERERSHAGHSSHGLHQEVDQSSTEKMLRDSHARVCQLRESSDVDELFASYTLLAEVLSIRDGELEAAKQQLIGAQQRLEMAQLSEDELTTQHDEAHDEIHQLQTHVVAMDSEIKKLRASSLKLNERNEVVEGRFAELCTRMNKQATIMQRVIEAKEVALEQLEKYREKYGELNSLRINTPRLGTSNSSRRSTPRGSTPRGSTPRGLSLIHISEPTRPY